ncbi:HD domain-containing protein [Polluticoccus soli]|uniref:HD domain-containing protein n=1 Tax=Polluticoccus soli TaxID=3034150 RepID=UPI0023E3376F|nr:HD domain-containing protein [Flavipsychrobacter sp. JY13-12]
MQFNEVKTFILDKLTQELPAHLTYHSVGHIRDVYDSAGYLAKEEGVRGEDLQLLLTAALFHDSGFLISQKEHEKLSCEVCKQYLPGFGYTREQIEKICGMVIATRIPQQPQNLLEQIICDADLDYLGRDDFFPIGDQLFSELKTFKVINTEHEWNRLQVDFLEKHHYFTATALQLRKHKKEENLMLVREKVKSAAV